MLLQEIPLLLQQYLCFCSISVVIVLKFSLIVVIVFFPFYLVLCIIICLMINSGKKIKTTECKGTSAEKNGHHNIFVDKYGMKGVIHLTVFES